MAGDESRPEEVDVAVIGGGVSGIGIAREAASRGYSTVLFERASLGQGVSANSHRIIHGGFRYLKELDLARTIDSLRAAARLRAEHPDLVVELPCLMPLDRWGPKSGAPVRGALMAYGALARACGAPSPGRIGSVLSSRAVEEATPLLRNRAPYGALLWFDNRLKDHDALVERLSSSPLPRLTVREGARVARVTRIDDQFRLEVTSPVGERDFVLARAVVEATGPWIERRGDWSVEAPTEGSRLEPLAKGWCKAFNVVLSFELDPTYAIGVEGRDSKRLFFIAPRNGRSAIGTEYLPWSGDPATAAVSEAKVASFLGGLDGAIEHRKLTVEDVARVEVGVLPVEGFSADGRANLYKREKIRERNGYLEVLSTKYTVFEQQAKRVVEKLDEALGRHSR